jgi:hypothetical protein
MSFDFDAFKRWCGQVDRRDDATVGGAVVEIERLRETLQSIADNTCCDGCREAGRVAALALKGADQ